MSAKRVTLAAIEWDGGWLIPIPPNEGEIEWYVLADDDGGSFYKSSADVREFASGMLHVAEEGEDQEPTDEERGIAEAYNALADLIDELSQS